MSSIGVGAREKRCFSFNLCMLKPDRSQSKALLIIDKHGSEIARNSVYDCHLLPDWDCVTNGSQKHRFWVSNISWKPNWATNGSRKHSVSGWQMAVENTVLAILDLCSSIVKELFWLLPIWCGSGAERKGTFFLLFQLFACIIFHVFVVVCWHFSKLNFSKKFFQVYPIRVSNGLGPDWVQIVCKYYIAAGRETYSWCDQSIKWIPYSPCKEYPHAPDVIIPLNEYPILLMLLYHVMNTPYSIHIMNSPCSWCDQSR